MASPNISEITTTTLRSRSTTLADNVTNSIAILTKLKEKGNVKTISGGEDIVRPLEYAENETATWYSGYETLDITPQDVITAAHYAWKQAAVSVSASGLETEVQNTGKEAIIKLLSARIKNAERSLMDLVATAMYADGTGSSSKEIGGLQYLVADTPTTGTVGGINRATWDFWQNISFDASTDGGAAVTSANIQSYMNQLWVQLVRGREHPDCIFADNTYYRAYWESLQAIQRVSKEKYASAGFESLGYVGGLADVFLDGGSGGHCPANHMYFLNTNYIFLEVAKNRNFTVLNPDRFGQQQDAIVKLMGFAGNMTMSNAALQGVLKA